MLLEIQFNYIGLETEALGLIKAILPCLIHEFLESYPDDPSQDFEYTFDDLKKIDWYLDKELLFLAAYSLSDKDEEVLGVSANDIDTALKEIFSESFALLDEELDAERNWAICRLGRIADSRIWSVPEVHW